MARGIRVDAIRRRLSGLGEIRTAVPHVGDDGAIVFEFTVATSADPALLAALEEDGVTASRSEPVVEHAPPAEAAPLVSH